MNMSYKTIELIGTIGVYIFAFVFGATIGSFLNVCIYRLPKGESLVKRNSHCMTCGAEIKRYDLIPILSWILLKGRCRNCGEPISPRYMIVESLTALCFLGVFIKFDVTFGGFVYPILLCLFIASVIVVGFEDFDTQEMSLSVLAVMSLFAFAEVAYLNFFANIYVTDFSGVTLSDSIWGMFIISVPLLLIGFVITPIFHTFLISEDHAALRKLRRRIKHDTLSENEKSKIQSLITEISERIKSNGPVFGMGMGDIVLMAAAGLLLGIKAIIVSFMIGAILAALYAVSVIIRRRRNPDFEMKSFAFGPYLCIGIVTAVFFGNAIANLYLSGLGIN
ncbi:MAG: prepilin peptidase [Ruminococcus sp.]|jgi:leader peptidase (prepilin peptidase)/N-methyltransferase|nr:prepilin peptidase [Ruminococcus sp.]